MAAVPEEINILLEPYFQTPEFTRFQKSVQDDKYSEDSPFTIREIFSDKPEKLDELNRLLYLRKKKAEGDEEAAALVTDQDVESWNVLNDYVARYERSPVDVEAEGAADPDYTLDLDPKDSTYQELLQHRIDPRYRYDAKSSLYDRWWKGQLNLSLLPQIDADSPYRVKSFFFPEAMTPAEARFLVKNEDPKAEFAYINPTDPDRGLVIRSPRTGGQWRVFRPQFGMEWATESLTDLVGKEMTGLTFEMIGLKGLGKFMQEGIKRSGKEVGIAGVSAAFGRLAQLGYGRARDINNVDAERAMKDAGFAALMGTMGAAAADVALRIGSRVWSTATGKFIPESVLKRIRATAEGIRKNVSLQEFSEEELRGLIEEAAKNVGKDVKAYRGTLGELSQEDYFKKLEMDLFSYLGGSSKGRAAYEKLMADESNQLYTAWEGITRNAEHLEGANFASFKDYIEQQNKRVAEEAREAVAKMKEQRLTEVGQKEAEVFGPGTAAERAATRETTEELADPFTRTVEGGVTPWFRYDSPEMTLARDQRYQELLQNYADAAEELNLQYPNRTTANVKHIKKPFEDFLGSIGKPGDIIRHAEDAEAARVARDMVPMRYGTNSRGEEIEISSMWQLLGLEVDPTPEGMKRILPKLQPSAGDLINMREAVRHVFMNHPTRAVRERSRALMEGIELQLDDLIRLGAREEMKKETRYAGVESFTDIAVEKWIRETGYAAPLKESYDALRHYSQEINSKWLRDFVSKDAEEIASYVLESSPKQIDNLFQEIYRGGEGAIRRLQNIRELVLRNVKKAVGDGPLEEQNRNWVKYFDKYSDRLATIFPDKKFLEFKNWAKFQESALADIGKVAEGLANLEKELGQPLFNFVEEFIEGGAAKVRSGKTQSLDQIQKVLKEQPELQEYVNAIVKDRLRAKFETQVLGQTGALGPGGTMLSGGFDAAAFNDFVSGPFAAGPLGTSDFSTILSKLMGPEVGQRYAKNLRKMNVLLQRAVNRRPGGPLPQGPTAESTVRETVRLFGFLQSLLISPLTLLSRRVTLGKEEVGRRSADHLLEILLDPTKVDALLRFEGKKQTMAQWTKFLAALAMTHSIDIGAELNQTETDRFINTLKKELGEHVVDPTKDFYHTMTLGVFEEAS